MMLVFWAAKGVAVESSKPQNVVRHPPLVPAPWSQPPVLPSPCLTLPVSCPPCVYPPLVLPPPKLQATARPQFPPIAPPSAPLTNNKAPHGHTPPSSSEHGSVSGEHSGKELDLFYRGGGDHSGGFGRRSPGGGGGGGNGRSGGRGGRQSQHAEMVAGTTAGGLPAERTSYMFCPEAHGMMR